MKDIMFDTAKTLVESMKTSQRKKLIALFVDQPKGETTPPTSPTPATILTRRQTADRFNRHVIFVDRLVKKDLLHRVILPGSKRGCGFRSTEVEALITNEN
jgi:hypothetical protein